MLPKPELPTTRVLFIDGNANDRALYVSGLQYGSPDYEIIEAAGSFGWKTFDMAIMELFEQGLVTEETALLYCTNKGVVTRGLDKIKKIRGETTSSLTGLALDVEYGKKK